MRESPRRSYSSLKESREEKKKKREKRGGKRASRPFALPIISKVSFYQLKRYVILPKDFQRTREVNSMSFIPVHEGPGGQNNQGKDHPRGQYTGGATDQTMSYDKHRIVTSYIPDPRSKGARKKLDYAVSDTSILFPAKSRYAPPTKKVTVHSTSTT